MAKIFLKPKEGIKSALHRFKKEVNKADIMKEYSKHSYYESPSEKRRRKEKAKIKELRRQQK